MSRLSAPKPTDPAQRMGIYQTLDAVADRHRLKHYHAKYTNQDVARIGGTTTWDAFMDYERDVRGYISDRYRENADRAGRSWRAHMADQGRHYACADPVHVEEWVANLLDRIQIDTAYNTYWIRIERFYDWLIMHTDHPHRYSPVLMAANEYRDGASGRLWMEKIGRNDKRDTPNPIERDQ